MTTARVSTTSTSIVGWTQVRYCVFQPTQSWQQLSFQYFEINLLTGNGKEHIQSFFLTFS